MRDAHGSSRRAIAAGGGSAPSLVTPGVLLLIAVIALGLWLLPPALTEGASTMYLGWAGFVLAVVVVWWLWRRR
jgi:hypothetical protein